MTHGREHHIPVTRTARYVTLGEPAQARDVWFVLHGHGQLAAYFVRHFAVLEAPGVFVAAPEALSRFYLEHTTWRGAGHARVGATWMTREDRLAEISDYVAYLDRLYAHVFSQTERGHARFTVLGFSQGVATACRWLCSGVSRADRLILWAGPLPHDLDHAAAAPLRALKLARVLGDEDDMSEPSAVAAETERAQALGLPPEVTRFDGGHQMHPATLKRLAEEL